MAAGVDDVLPAVEVDVHEARPPAHERRLVLQHVRLARDVLEEALAEVVVERAVVVGEVGGIGVEPAVVVVVGEVDAHSRLLVAVAAERQAAHDAALVEAAVAAIHEEQARRRVVGDVDVEIAVVVDVARHDPEPEIAVPVVGARGHGTLAERAVSVVVEEVVGRAGKPAWPAEHRSPEVVAGATRDVGRQLVRPNVEVAGDVDVEKAVAIEVAERGR